MKGDTTKLLSDDNGSRKLVGFVVILQDMCDPGACTVDISDTNRQ